MLVSQVHASVAARESQQEANRGLQGQTVDKSRLQFLESLDANPELIEVIIECGVWYSQY